MDIWERRREEERSLIFGIGVKRSKIPYIKCVGKDPTVEIDPPK